MKLIVINAGGFPKGVTFDNLLTTPSIPRNRLLADILAKTGIVERSGQGMDKIFLNTLSEGKPEPDYSESDDFNVTAILSANVKDKQAKRADLNTLIGNHLSEKQLRSILEQLKKEGKLKTEGQNRNTVYLLGDAERADK